MIPLLSLLLLMCPIGLCVGAAAGYWAAWRDAAHGVMPPAGMDAKSVLFYPLLRTFNGDL